MFFNLLGFILIWMAIFSFAVTFFLLISRKSRAPWVKKMAARFGGDLSEAPEIIQGFSRFGVLFGAMGILILLISSPGPAPVGETPFTISFSEGACVIVILWQVKRIWEMSRAGTRTQLIKKQKKK